MTFSRKLVRLTDAYCASRGVSAATVSGIIFKNSRTIPRVKAGGDLATRSYERAVQWFSDNWPTDQAWPADVERRPTPEHAQ